MMRKNPSQSISRGRAAHRTPHTAHHQPVYATGSRPAVHRLSLQGCMDVASLRMIGVYSVIMPPARTRAMASDCSVCGEKCDNDIRLLNHMMEKHGWRNPNADKPDRNSRGY